MSKVVTILVISLIAFELHSQNSNENKQFGSYLGVMIGAESMIIQLNAEVGIKRWNQYNLDGQFGINLARYKRKYPIGIDDLGYSPFFSLKLDKYLKKQLAIIGVIGTDYYFDSSIRPINKSNLFPFFGIGIDKLLKFLRMNIRGMVSFHSDFNYTESIVVKSINKLTYERRIYPRIGIFLGYQLAFKE